MNNKQKIFAILSILGIIIWITSTIHAVTYFISDDLFKFDSIISAISFAIGLGSFAGFFLFKDK